MEFRILGLLDVRVGPAALALPGGKQRTVLATLLLRPGEIVSIERLVDELWGESPPASAQHTLEVYVSRLRQLLNGHGTVIARRGTGYVLELAGAKLDAQSFVEFADAASHASATGDHAHASEVARTALALWRGLVLADVALGPAARADAERLEERRLRTLEVQVDAELALGRHEEVVGELQSLVAHNPYRERYVAQLMIALYRSGRHAEALDAYEQTRRRLDGDLGLQPSADLQQLSAQIVRQEPDLQAPSAESDAVLQSAARVRARRLSGLVALGAAVAAAVTLSAAGAARQYDVGSDSEAMRLALVVQEGRPDDAASEWRRSELTSALVTLEADGDLESSGGVDSELLPFPEEFAPHDVERTARSLAAGDFDLVLFGIDTDSARELAPYMRKLAGTRSVFLGSSLNELGLRDAPNVSAVRFALEQPAQLAGALSGLMSPYAARGGGPLDVVSVVAAEPTPETLRIIDAFRHGFEQARPGGSVRVHYTHETIDPTDCELAANAQIDAGSDLIFVHSRHCGTGALAVAQTRGVWAISGDSVMRPGRHVLGSIVQDWDNSLYSVVRAFGDRSLPAGRDVVLSLDGYNVLLEMRGGLPVGIASRVVRLCSDIRLNADGLTIPTFAEP